MLARLQCKNEQGANLTRYDLSTEFQCLQCAEGCEDCVDRSALPSYSCADCPPAQLPLHRLAERGAADHPTGVAVRHHRLLACRGPLHLQVQPSQGRRWRETLLIILTFQVIKAASPVLLRIIILGAFFIYSTTLVLYPRPHVVRTEPGCPALHCPAAGHLHAPDLAAGDWVCSQLRGAHA